MKNTNNYMDIRFQKRERLSLQMKDLCCFSFVVYFGAKGTTT